MELRSGKTLCPCPKTRATTWSSIPDDILTLIAGKVTSVDDYVSLSSVCRSWYIFASETYDTSKHELNLLPLYMSVTNLSNRIKVRNPASDTKLVLDLPEIAGRRIWGSPFGWLVTFDRIGLSFSLVNPFTGATIQLPPLPESTLWSDSLDKLKVFLTACPDSDAANCLVIMVSAHSQIVFTRPHRHRKLWSPIQGRFDLISLTYHKGNLYGLESLSSSRSRVLLFQLNHVVPRVVKFLDLAPYTKSNYNTSYEEYLVDFNGDLCLYIRFDLELFKIDVSTGDLTLRSNGYYFLINYYAVLYNLKEIIESLGSKKIVCIILNSPNPLCMRFWTVPCLKFSKRKR